MSETVRITCGYCGGRDMLGQGEDGPCPKCGDSGRVLVEVDSITAWVITQALPITTSQVDLINLLIEQYVPPAERVTRVQIALSNLRQWIRTQGQFPRGNSHERMAPV